MKVNLKLSQLSASIQTILRDSDLSAEEKIEVLSQSLLKIFLLYSVDKEGFFKYLSDVFDDLEEKMNTLGFK